MSGYSSVKSELAKDINEGTALLTNVKYLFHDVRPALEKFIKHTDQILQRLDSNDYLKNAKEFDVGTNLKKCKNSLEHLNSRLTFESLFVHQDLGLLSQEGPLSKFITHKNSRKISKKLSNEEIMEYRKLCLPLVKETEKKITALESAIRSQKLQLLPEGKLSLAQDMAELGKMQTREENDVDDIIDKFKEQMAQILFRLKSGAYLEYAKKNDSADMFDVDSIIKGLEKSVKRIHLIKKGINISTTIFKHEKNAEFAREFRDATVNMAASLEDWNNEIKPVIKTQKAELKDYLAQKRKQQQPQERRVIPPIARARLQKHIPPVNPEFLQKPKSPITHMNKAKDHQQQPTAKISDTANKPEKLKVSGVEFQQSLRAMAIECKKLLSRGLAVGNEIKSDIDVIKSKLDSYIKDGRLQDADVKKCKFYVNIIYDAIGEKKPYKLKTPVPPVQPPTPHRHRENKNNRLSF